MEYDLISQYEQQHDQLDEYLREATDVYADPIYSDEHERTFNTYQRQPRVKGVKRYGYEVKDVLKITPDTDPELIKEYNKN